MTSELGGIDSADVDQIDISDLTPNEIAKRLIVLSRQLYAQVGEFRAAGRNAAELKKEARLAFSRSFLSAEGAMDLRRHHAEIASADAKFDAEVADHEVAASKEALKAMHAILDVGRTLSATTRDEMKLSGVDSP